MTGPQQYDPNFGWGPAIPLPLYGGALWWNWYGCHCNERFETEDDYREHYARTHWGEKPANESGPE